MMGKGWDYSCSQTKEKRWGCCYWQTKEKGWRRDGAVVVGKQKKRGQLLANKGKWMGLLWARKGIGAVASKPNGILEPRKWIGAAIGKKRDWAVVGKQMEFLNQEKGWGKQGWNFTTKKKEEMGLL